MVVGGSKFPLPWVIFGGFCAFVCVSDCCCTYNMNVISKRKNSRFLNILLFSVLCLSSPFFFVWCDERRHNGCRASIYIYVHPHTREKSVRDGKKHQLTPFPLGPFWLSFLPRWGRILVLCGGGFCVDVGCGIETPMSNHSGPVHHVL